MHYFLFLVYSSLTGIGVLGFSKIEIERKHQRNFQTDFIKFRFQHKGGGPEERKVLRTDSGAGSAWLFYKLGTKKALMKRRAF